MLRVYRTVHKAIEQKFKPAVVQKVPFYKISARSAKICNNIARTRKFAKITTFILLPFSFITDEQYTSLIAAALSFLYTYYKASFDVIKQRVVFEELIGESLLVKTDRINAVKEGITLHQDKRWWTHWYGVQIGARRRRFQQGGLFVWLGLLNDKLGLFPEGVNTMNHAKYISKDHLRPKVRAEVERILENRRKRILFPLVSTVSMMVTATPLSFWLMDSLNNLAYWPKIYVLFCTLWILANPHNAEVKAAYKDLWDRLGRVGGLKNAIQKDKLHLYPDIEKASCMFVTGIGNLRYSSRPLNTFRKSVVRSIETE